MTWGKKYRIKNSYHLLAYMKGLFIKEAMSYGTERDNIEVTRRQH